MRNLVACGRCGDCATLHHGQDVLCTLSGYGLIPKHAKGRAHSSEGSERDCIISGPGVMEWGGSGMTLPGKAAGIVDGGWEDGR